MKINWKIIFGVSLCTGLSACEELKFTTALTVLHPITLKSTESPKNCDDQFDWWNCSEEPEVLNLEANEYHIMARLSNTQKTTQLILEIPQNKEKKIITIESSKKLSEGDQTFSLTSEDIQQEFSLNGALNTKVEDGPNQSDIESCTYLTREYICREVTSTPKAMALQDPKDKDSKKGYPVERGHGDTHQHRPLPPPPKVVCGYENVSHWGHQNVEFHMKYTTKTLALSFVKDNGIAAYSNGTWSGSDKIYTFKEACH